MIALAALPNASTLASHRRAAFDGAEFLMDYLKTDAPFWKKATAPDGAAHWVEANGDDDAARTRWEKQAGGSPLPSPLVGEGGASTPDVG